MARGVCTIEGCGGVLYGNGYCNKHNLRLRRHGHPLASGRKVKPIKIFSDHAEVQLTRGYAAKINLSDVDVVAKHNWHARIDGNTVYAWSTIRDGGPTISLHRLLLGVQDGHVIDHIDGDGLNCRRDNLRHATPSQNQHNKRTGKNNTSGFKGVRLAKWATGPSKWRATIFFGGRHRSLGYFVTAEEAANAYDAAARQTFGDFALLNSQMAGG